jgi:CRISPR/Cas system CSM-associated protein Csm3 (group 7 of RAMP superfamily)/uncharacterized protein YqgQ
MNRDQTLSPKPYDFVSFPQTKPTLAPPIGHDRYHADRLHGALHLTLTVQTALHVSTGITALGSDVGSRLPLIKTMTTTDHQLVLQGSSLKGCLRSVYEAITNSTLAVITHSVWDKKNKKKIQYSHKYPDFRKPLSVNLKKSGENRLCPAGRVFGALNYQGLIEFSDARCNAMKMSDGFIRSLHSPSLQAPNYYNNVDKVKGRKFYYNMVRLLDKKEQGDGFDVQQAGRAYQFETVIYYKNLLPEELGILFLILGQDQKTPIALKVGAGKPIGMGTMTATVTAIKQADNISDRYCKYQVDDAQMTNQEIQTFIDQQISAAYHSKLLEKEQWHQISTILKYPGDHEPPKGMY